MRLVLPWPPTANLIWRTAVVRGRARTFLSKDGKAYKQAVANLCREAAIIPLAGKVSVTLRYFRPTLRGDLDNRLKVLLDSLNGYAWGDDAQVAEIHATLTLDREDPRVEVQVMPLGTPGAAISQAFREHEAEVERIVAAGPECNYIGKCNSNRCPLHGAPKDETPAERIRRLAKPNRRGP